MQPGCLVRLELNGGRVAKETRYLGELNEHSPFRKDSSAAGEACADPDAAPS